MRQSGSMPSCAEYLTDHEDAFAADTAIDVFEAEGRRGRALPALEAEIDIDR